MITQKNNENKKHIIKQACTSTHIFIQINKI
jgi:hypothetical protein